MNFALKTIIFFVGYDLYHLAILIYLQTPYFLSIIKNNFTMEMVDKNQIEKAILWALKMNGLSESMSLNNLIGWIDLRLRILVSLPEINNALEKLISEGRVEEYSHLYYSLSNSSNTNSNVFITISESEYEEAVETYKMKLDQAAAELEAEEEKFGVSRRLITIIWMMGGREFDDDMEDVLNQLAEKLELILEKEREKMELIKPESLLLDGIEIGNSPDGNEVIIWIQGYDEDNPFKIFNKISNVIQNFNPRFGNLRVVVHPLNKEDITYDYE
jgi:hypothetical protein